MTGLVGTANAKDAVQARALSGSWMRMMDGACHVHVPWGPWMRREGPREGPGRVCRRRDRQGREPASSTATATATATQETSKKKNPLQMGLGQT
jgi:hypothetical protein